MPDWLVQEGLAWQQISLAKAANDRRIFYFEHDRIVHLKQEWQVPRSIDRLSIQGATIRLRLVWWANKAEVLIDGNLVQTGDLFDQKCRLLLCQNAQLDRTFKLELKLEKPTHDRGALQTCEILVEYPNQPCDPSKLADELGVIQAYLPILAQHGFDLETTVSELEQVLADPISETSLEEFAKIGRSLLPIGEFLKQRKVWMLGNAHIDIAWLWSIEETKEAIDRTFNSVLDLQKRYPELIFNQSSALTYEWIEQSDPKLFGQIQNAIEQQRWEPIGGMWVEPDCNLPSGESLIRQILYGKKYFREKFDLDIKIAWFPDTFGFNWQLPQILTKSGFTAFITQKLTWNDTNKFPAQIFWWQGLDGSKILTYFSNEIGLGIEPVSIAQFLSKQESQHQIKDCLWLYGVGDRGGGPTADMLDLSREWSESDIFFTVESSTAQNFISSLLQNLDPDMIPTWRDELYLEFHRGTYTSKADQKRKHRQAEILLTNTEKYCSIDAIFHNRDYPNHLLEKAWKGLLLNQFHDIIPGTSIPEVYQDADLVWDEINQICRSMIDEIDSLYPKLIWNFSNWSRTEIIEISHQYPANQTLAVHSSNCSGLVPTQRTEHGLIFNAKDIPSFGCCDFALVAVDRSESLASIPPLSITPTSLENQYLKVSIDPETGDIRQIYDHRYGNTLLKNACELQFYEDKGQYWDAWNIDPKFEQKKLIGLTLESIQIKQSGVIRGSLQVIRKFRQSRFVQEIELDAYSPFITVKNWVDWQEEQILVKAAFPLSFQAPFATYEIPMGSIDRSTIAETPEAKAKFEVPAQFWADMSTSGMGLSVLNDCKYGYDAQPDCLRLTLLRSPKWPCPDSDRGEHLFTYRLLPHQGSWQNAQTVQRAYELNSPLSLHRSIETLGDLTNLSFLSTSSHSIILSAFKRSEDMSSWILRFYEAHGERVEASIEFLPNIIAVQECDLLENPISQIQHQLNQFGCEFQPFEIKTFRLEFENLSCEEWRHRN